VNALELFQAAAWKAVAEGDLDTFLAVNGLAEVTMTTEAPGSPKDALTSASISPRRETTAGSGTSLSGALSLRSLPRCIGCKDLFDPAVSGKVPYPNAAYGVCSTSCERDVS
jgi:hypothetical protein